MSKNAIALLAVAASALVGNSQLANAQIVLRSCRPMREVQVDTTVDVSSERSSALYVRLEGPEPLFPMEMRSAGISGVVRAAFVVDTLGRVARGSAQIIEETNEAFGTSVCDYFEKAKFEPVVVRGRKIKARFVNARFVFPLRRG